MPQFFIYLLKVNIALLVLYALYYGLLRRLTFYTLNRWFLLGSIVVASAFPLINMEHIFYSATNPGNNVILNSTPNWNQLISIISTRESTFTIWSTMYSVYWLGVVAMFILFMIQIFSFIHIHLHATKQSNLIWTTSQDIQPLSFCRNIYINPAKHSPQALQTILQHEKVHASQWHTVDILLAEINKIIYWFNPGVWLLKRAIRENLEYIADKKVLETGKDAKQYQYELLQVITGASKATAITSQFSLLHLKNRITMMNKQKSGSWNKAKYLLLLPILGIVAVVVAQKNSTGAFGQQQTMPNLESDNDKSLNDFISRHPNVKTAMWGYINQIETDDATLKENIEPGPVLHIGFRNDKFEVYQYNLSKDRIKFKNSYGEEMPICSQSVLNAISNPLAAHPTTSDYLIIVKAIGSGVYAIAYDKNRKEVSRIKLDDNNSKAIKKWEAVFGKIPPPPPPPLPSKPAASSAASPAPSMQNSANDLPADLPMPVVEKLVSTEEKIPGNINHMKIDIHEKDVIVERPIKPGFKVSDKNGPQPLYVLDGTIVPIYELNLIDAQQIQTIDILKGNAATALYGDQGKEGVVLIKTKKANMLLQGNPIVSLKAKKKEQPLFVVNNAIASQSQVGQIDPQNIKTVNVLKDKSAIATYGEKGKNGVLVITTKD